MFRYNRLEKVKNLRWEFGSVVPADIKSNMSEMEVSLTYLLNFIMHI